MILEHALLNVKPGQSAAFETAMAEAAPLIAASPGFLGESMQIYLARDIKQGAANPEEDEHIEIVRTPLSKALALIAADKIHDGKTLIGVLFYAAAHREGRL